MKTLGLKIDKMEVIIRVSFFCFLTRATKRAFMSTTLDVFVGFSKKHPEVIVAYAIFLGKDSQRVKMDMEFSTKNKLEVLTNPQFFFVVSVFSGKTWVHFADIFKIR